MARFGQRVFAVVLIAGLAAAVAYSFQILLLVFAGILLAVLLRSAGTWLHGWTQIPMGWCMGLVLVGFATLFFGSIFLFGIQIANQTDELVRAVSHAWGELQSKIRHNPIAGSVASAAVNLETPAKAAASGVVSIVASMVMVLFIGVYLSTSPQMYTDLFLGFFRGPMRGRVRRLLDATGSALRWWLAGQFIAMAVVGAVTTAGLLVIHAPMAISLGVLAAVLTFIPYIGAIGSAIPAILLALTKSNEMALYVLVIFLVAHIVEGYIVVPLVQHKLVYLPPAMILVMQFFMELFAGIIGMAFATPLMVVAMVLIKKLYFKQDWDNPEEDAAAAA